MKKSAIALLKRRLNPKKKADREWYLALLDDGKQRAAEEEHLRAELAMLKARYLTPALEKNAADRAEIAALQSKRDYSADDYARVLALNAAVARQTARLNSYKPFFAEPYFARMDVVDDKEGYNSYYIGKKGDVGLEIVDWRAPLAVRYYQKSRVRFTINEYDYRTVLRRALSVKNGKLIDFKNEYLSVKDVLTPEEIAGRDEEIYLDPYLRSIVKSRKDDETVRDIIETIQERQFEIVTRPERESFVLQGCAGSGKTMILLHRISYLMYNNEKLRPNDILVITPSDSFNAFIDELAQALELERVRTVTLKTYYFQALAGEGIDLASKLSGARETEEYLRYLYSPRFCADAEKRIAKLYGDLRGLFAAEECREVAERVLSDCARRRAAYAAVKNASIRVRRAVLGEMKDDGNGGYYFTRPFRALMGAYAQAEDFLRFVLEEPERTPDYFFRQFRSYYRGASLAAKEAEQVYEQADADLARLFAAVEKEIGELSRYRVRGAGEELAYADRIGRRRELLAEISSVRASLQSMREGEELFAELFSVIRSAKSATELGKCESGVDVARWLYRETVKKYKAKYGVYGVVPSDGFALSYLLTAAGRQLKPRFGLVFIDEGQDIAPSEYALLRRIHADAAFNVFGDLMQNVTPWRGMRAWEGLDLPVCRLDRNYRNTNEIVGFVRETLGAEMDAIGLHGDAVVRIKPRALASFFRGKKGTKALIAREDMLEKLTKRGYVRVGADGKLSKTAVNVLTVYESKGLEFSAVAVCDSGMTDNEKYIAYTRALRELVIVEAS